MTLLLPRSAMAVQSTGTHTGEVITADTSAHTKGSYVALLPALEFDGFLSSVYITDTRTNSTDTSSLVDIGIDPAGGTSYTELINNVLAGHAQESVNHVGGRETVFPVYIPAGSTVAARMQSLVTGGKTARVTVAVHGGIPSENPFPGQGPVITYGVTVGSSSGTTLPEVAADTKSAWQEIIASTTHPHRGVTFGVQGADASDFGLPFLFDIGIGAAASEVVLVGDIYVPANGTEIWGNPFPTSAFRRPIPEGSRLSVRAQTTDADRTDEMDVQLFGWG